MTAACINQADRQLASTRIYRQYLRLNTPCGPATSLHFLLPHSRYHRDPSPSQHPPEDGLRLWRLQTFSETAFLASPRCTLRAPPCELTGLRTATTHHHLLYRTRKRPAPDSHGSRRLALGSRRSLCVLFSSLRLSTISEQHKNLIQSWAVVHAFNPFLEGRGR